MNDSKPDFAGLGFGTFFVVVGAAFTLHQLEVWELQLSYLLPLVLIGVGVSMLVGWAASMRSDSTREAP